ncbi:MAG: LysR family transcriptional regulator [Lachnospiraceae bacterium]
MTIRHLRIFVTVAKTENMRAAAEQLYLSQPTVSQAIRELEVHYDTYLFARLSKRLFITEAGEALLQHALSVLAKYDELEYNMRKDHFIQHVRIGSTITISSDILPSLISEFEESHPKIATFSLTGNTQQIEEKLLKNELDIGIIEGEIHHKDLISRSVLGDYLVLACACTHPLAQHPVLHLQDLHPHPFVMRESGSGTRELFLQSLQEKSMSVRIKMEASYPDAIKNAVLYNQCLAVLSIRLLKQEIREQKISAYTSSIPNWNRTFKLVYHKDTFLSHFIEDIEALLKKYTLSETDTPKGLLVWEF